MANTFDPLDPALNLTIEQQRMLIESFANQRFHAAGQYQQRNISLQQAYNPSGAPMGVTPPYTNMTNVAGTTSAGTSALPPLLESRGNFEGAREALILRKISERGINMSDPEERLILSKHSFPSAGSPGAIYGPSSGN